MHDGKQVMASVIDHQEPQNLEPWKLIVETKSYMYFHENNICTQKKWSTI